MRRNYILVLLGLLLLGLLVTNAYAEGEKFALSTKAGTLGGGLEGIAKINPYLNAKLGVNGFIYEYDGTESDIEYDVDLELLSFAALLDWLPFAGNFRITTGLLANQNSVELSAKAAGTYEVGNATYTTTQVGTLNGKLDFNDVAPYVGIGWGNPFNEDDYDHWSFSLDLGVMFQGSPKVDLSADGTLANDAAFMANLEREEENLESEIDEFEFYPVVSLGVAYRF